MSGSASAVDVLQASHTQAYHAINCLPLKSALLVCVGDSRPRRCVCVLRLAAAMVGTCNGLGVGWA
jgi:hypothetical protein